MMVWFSSFLQTNKSSASKENRGLDCLRRPSQGEGARPEFRDQNLGNLEFFWGKDRIFRGRLLFRGNWREDLDSLAERTDKKTLTRSLN